MPPDVGAVAAQILCALEEAGIEHALGGALAVGLWSIPRGTIDVDIAVYVESPAYGQLFELLERLGARLDRELATVSAEERGMFSCRISGYRVDLFVPDIPLYDWARDRRRRCLFQGKPHCVWSPEDAVLFKLLFFRPKDLVDVEQLIQVQMERLDRGYLTRSIEALVGEEDDRTVWLKSALARWLDHPTI